MVFLNLRKKKIKKHGDIRNISLPPEKQLTILIHGMASYVIK